MALPYIFYLSRRNYAPSDIVLSSNSVSEDEETGYVIGTFSTSDVNPNDTFIYTIVQDNDNKFSITNNQLILNVGIDYETSQTHDVTIRVTDQKGLSYDKVFTINVIDVDDTWSPETTSSLLWLDASDDTTVIHTAGVVSQWNDKSGNLNHFPQSVEALRPSNTGTLNGLTTISFNEDFLEIASVVSGIRTVVIVTDALNGSSNSFVSSLYSGSGNTDSTFVSSNTTDGNYDISVDGNGSFSGTVRWCGNTGVSGTNIDLGNTNAQNIGPSVWVITYDQNIGIEEIGRVNSSLELIGNIAELRAYSTVLALEDIQKQEGYEAHKWGLTANLPNDHPYKYDGREFGYPLIWTPSEMSSTVSYYDASLLVGSGSVSQIDDQHTGGIHLTQAVGSRQPVIASGENGINGLTALSFSGSQALFASNAFQDFGNSDNVILCVAKRITTSYDWFYRASDGWIGLNHFSNNLRSIHSNSFSNNVVPNTSDGNAHIWGHRREGVNQASIFDGVMDDYAAVATDTTVNQFVMGAESSGGGNGLDGLIGQLVILKSPTTEDVKKLEGYLAHKWGLTNNLPSDHPYKYDGREFGYPLIWKPSDISTNEIWFDARDASTILQTANKISQWSDKSGRDHHVLQNVGSSQPTYIPETNEVYFDGTTFMQSNNINMQTLAGNGGKTSNIFMVVKFVSGVVYYSHYGNTSTTRHLLEGDDRYDFGTSYPAGIDWDTPLSSSEYQILECRKSENESDILINNVSVKSGSHSATLPDLLAPLCLGARRDGAFRSVVYFKEILHFSDVLSSEDQGKVISYLSSHLGTG